MRKYGKTILAATVLALAGCSGGSEPLSPVRPDAGNNPPDQGGLPSLESCSNTARPDFGAEPGQPGGFWQGVVSLEPNQTTDAVQGLVTEDGRYWFWEGYDQWVGSFTVSGTTFSGDGIAYSGGTTWGDGSLVTSVDVLGVFAERETLVADWTMGSGNWGCFAVDYDAELYERPSDLADIAGSWEELDDWGLTWELTVDTEGNFLLLDPYECLMAGRIGIIDDRFALYEISDAKFTCRTDEAGFAGIAYTYRSIYAPTEGDDVIVLRTHNGARARSYVFWNRLP